MTGYGVFTPFQPPVLVSEAVGRMIRAERTCIGPGNYTPTQLKVYAMAQQAFERGFRIKLVKRVD